MQKNNEHGDSPRGKRKNILMHRLYLTILYFFFPKRNVEHPKITLLAPKKKVLT